MFRTRYGRTLPAIALMAFLSSLPNIAVAQTDYPNREVKVICNFAAGTGADLLIRFFTNKVGPMMGKPIVVENKVGATGNIGIEAAARSRPDGYTLLIVPGNSSMAAAPSLFKSIPFDPIKDFEHITTLSHNAFVLIVDPTKTPVNSVAELTAYLHKKGKVSFGTSNAQSLATNELYNSFAKLNALRVNYRSPQAILTDLYAGEIDFTFIGPANMLVAAKDGKLRALAITTATPMAATPWPTMKDAAGIPEFDLREWWSVQAPLGTPKPIVDKLEGLFNQVVLQEETKTFLLTLGMDPLPGNQKLVRDMLERDSKKWADLVRVAKIEPQ